MFAYLLFTASGRLRAAWSYLPFEPSIPSDHEGAPTPQPVHVIIRDAQVSRHLSSCEYRLKVVFHIGEEHWHT